MYVVRRPFRNLGVMLEAGSVVELASIKRFKTRLKDRYIVEVNPVNFESWNSYFKDKYGTEIKVPVVKQETEDVHEVEDVQEPVVNQEPEKKEEPAKPKEVKRAVAVAKPKA